MSDKRIIAENGQWVQFAETKKFSEIEDRRPFKLGEWYYMKNGQTTATSVDGGGPKYDISADETVEVYHWQLKPITVTTRSLSL